MEVNQQKELIKQALNILNNSYSPYSNYRVGASLLTKSGKIFSGANIENASYPCCICAEQAAVSKAVSEGEREFLAVAIVASEKENLPYPCGVCRQVLSEFAPELEVIVAKDETDYKVYSLSELLPHSFELKK